MSKSGSNVKLIRIRFINIGSNERCIVLGDVQRIIVYIFVYSYALKS